MSNWYCHVHRWTVIFHPNEKETDEMKLALANDTNAANTNEDTTSIFLMNNYFGIGIDADLCLDFHIAREENPNKFNSRYVISSNCRCYRPFSTCRSLVHSTDTYAGLGFRNSFWVFFAYKKIVRPNWDAKSWEDGPSVDMNSLRHLPRWWSKNCDLLRSVNALSFPIGLYRDVWIAAIAWSRTSLETKTVVMCTTSQCKLRSLRANFGMWNVICIVT